MSRFFDRDGVRVVCALAAFAVVGLTIATLSYGFLIALYLVAHSLTH